jgi:hypothetical protein
MAPFRIRGKLPGHRNRWLVSGSGWPSEYGLPSRGSLASIPLLIEPPVADIAMADFSRVRRFQAAIYKVFRKIDSVSARAQSILCALILLGAPSILGVPVPDSAVLGVRYEFSDIARRIKIGDTDDICDVRFFCERRRP